MNHSTPVRTFAVVLNPDAHHRASSLNSDEALVLRKVKNRIRTRVKPAGGQVLKEQSVSVFRGIAHTLEAVTSQCAEFGRVWRRRGKVKGDVPRFWEGEWRSQENAHRGNLRCVLECLDQAHFRAFFKAKYSHFLRACYRVDLSAQRQGQDWNLQGEADLGKLAGGIYRYKGRIREGEFICEYRCRYDHGIFQLRALSEFDLERQHKS